MSKKILFVDADPDFRKKYRPMLEADGFTVVEAESAQQATELFASDKFDLALVGLRMEQPDSGFTLAYRMKKVDPNFPIIITSAVNGELGINFSLNSAAERAWIKADAFLNKPLRFEQLQFAIQNVLGAA